MNCNLLVVGVGGQGVMTAAEVLARAAFEAGFDVTKTEVAGMSQRGGVVCSQVRIGRVVQAAEIEPGTAHLLLALEAAELLRWCHWLKAGGDALVNTARVIPPIVNSGLARYPADPAGEARSLGYAVRSIDAGSIAAALGEPRLANSVMLGAAADRLPVAAEALLAQLLGRFAGNARLARLNAAAFAQGRQAAARSGTPCVPAAPCTPASLTSSVGAR